MGSAKVAISALDERSSSPSSEALKIFKALSDTVSSERVVTETDVIHAGIYSVTHMITANIKISNTRC